MARYYKYLVIYLLAFLLFSCQEGREAGDFLGQWRLEGSSSKYISFAGSIIMINHDATGQVYGNFQHTGDSLFIQCFSKNGEKTDTMIVEDIFDFKPIDNIRLKIETFNTDRLVLSKQEKTWSFLKY